MSHPPTALLAVEIGGSKLQICAGTPAGEILDRRRYTVEPALGAEGIRASLAAAVRELAHAWKPEAIGVGYGGPVDSRTGRIAKSYHIEGWSEFPLGEWLSQQVGLPVFVENDANVASYGEAMAGAGRGRNPVFYTTIGSGVGGGLVVDGKIYHGLPPSEMEFGHLRLLQDGTITEDVCSGWSLNRIVLRAIQENPASELAKLCAAQPGHEARHLGPALEKRDPVAETILETTTDYLAFGLNFVTHLLHPEVIVLGGGVSLIGEPLRSRVEKKLTGYLMDVFRPGPAILLAALREDAVPIGALLLAGERLRGSVPTHA
jgi:glucokinase